MTLAKLQAVVTAALGQGLRVQTYMKGVEHVVLVTAADGGQLDATILANFCTAQAVVGNVLQVEVT